MKFYRIFSERQARDLAEKAKSLSWNEGKARTSKLTGTVKQNSEILQHSMLGAIGQCFATHPVIQLDHIPFKFYAPKLSKYEDGQHYKRHTDAPWMGEVRTDLSCTLWLSDDYEGGELVIDGKSVKGKPGVCIVYNCGAPHEVRPVTAGQRICVITWIQSRVRDPIKRKIVSDFRKFIGRFEDDHEVFTEGGTIHSALLRMWIE